MDAADEQKLPRDRHASLIEMSERESQESSVQIKDEDEELEIYDQPGTSSTIKKFPGLARFRQKFQSVDQVSFLRVVLFAGKLL